MSNREFDKSRGKARHARVAQDQLPDVPEDPVQLVQAGVADHQTEHLVARELRGETTPAPKAAASADVRHLEQSLEERLGAKVSIEHGRRGGRLVIRYASLDELDGILGHIR